MDHSRRLLREADDVLARYRNRSGGETIGIVMSKGDRRAGVVYVVLFRQFRLPLRDLLGIDEWIVPVGSIQGIDARYSGASPRCRSDRVGVVLANARALRRPADAGRTVRCCMEWWR